MKAFIIILGVICWSSQCFAYTTLNKRDCGQWLSKKADVRLSAEIWLDGYLSGLSAMWELEKAKPRDPLSQLNSPSQAYLWTDIYCKGRPLDHLADGGLALFLELAKKAVEEKK
jgi:hypothetical protein